VSTAQVAALRELPDGTLRASNSRADLEVDPQDGGRLTSLRIDGIEILGSSPQNPGMPAGFFYGAFLMAPFIGRTRRGQFTFDSVVHQLPRNVGDNAMHGLVYDTGWHSIDGGVETAFDDRWPFGGGVRQRFSLTEEALVVTAEVFNDDRPMPAALGFHPWFLDQLITGERAVFEFEPKERFICDDDGIPVDSIPGGGPRPWDDSFRGVAHSPVIRWGGRLTVTIESDHDHWIVCETMPNSFCIEPLSGGVNALADGSAAIVEPGTPLALTMTLRWNSTPDTIASTDARTGTGTAR